MNKAQLEKDDLLEEVSNLKDLNGFPNICFFKNYQYDEKNNIIYIVLQYYE